jgi:hypothetical protein
MYAAIRRYEIPDPDAVEELTQRLKEGFLPIISEVPGFVAYYAVYEGEFSGLYEGDAVLTTVSIFEDLADAQRSTDVAADYVKQNLASLLPQAPTATVGDVVVAHR